MSYTWNSKEKVRLQEGTRCKRTVTARWPLSIHLVPWGRRDSGLQVWPVESPREDYLKK